MIEHIELEWLTEFCIDFYQLPKISPRKTTIMLGWFYIEFYWYRGSTGKM